MKIKKVEINGVNTSALPVLSQVDQMKMLKRIKAGEEQLKDQFINANLRLVLSMVKKFNNRGENVDDLFQVGVVGLIKAIDNFDISQNVQFSTYAVPMIIGEIKRFLRDNSQMRISRSIRDLSYLISKEREVFMAKENREPTIDEISSILKLPREEVILAIDSTIAPMSLNDAVYSDGGDTIYVLDQIKSEKNEMELVTEKISLIQALEKLSDKEKEVIQKRYFDNITQVELAEEIGVSQAQISRIEKTAIMRLKKRLEYGRWNIFTFHIIYYMGGNMYKIYVGTEIDEKYGVDTNSFNEKIKSKIVNTVDSIVFVNEYDEGTKDELEIKNIDMFVGIKIKYDEINELIIYTDSDNIMSNGLAKEIYNNVKMLFNEEQDMSIKYLSKVQSKSVIVDINIPGIIVDIKTQDINIIENIYEKIANGIENYTKIKFC